MNTLRCACPSTHLYHSLPCSVDQSATRLNVSIQLVPPRSLSLVWMPVGTGMTLAGMLAGVHKTLTSPPRRAGGTQESGAVTQIRDDR